MFNNRMQLARVFGEKLHTVIAADKNSVATGCESVENTLHRTATILPTSLYSVYIGGKVTTIVFSIFHSET